MSNPDKGKISLSEKDIVVWNLTEAMTGTSDPQIRTMYQIMLIEQLDGTENTKRDKKPNDRNPGMILLAISLFSLDGINSPFWKKDDENERIPSTIVECIRKSIFWIIK